MKREEIIEQIALDIAFMEGSSDSCRVDIAFDSIKDRVLGYIEKQKEQEGNAEITGMKLYDKIKAVLNKNNVYYEFEGLRRKLIESLAKEIEQIYTELTPNNEQEGMSAEELEDMFFSFIRTHHLRKKWDEFIEQYAASRIAEGEKQPTSGSKIFNILQEKFPDYNVPYCIEVAELIAKTK